MAACACVVIHNKTQKTDYIPLLINKLNYGIAANSLAQIVKPAAGVFMQNTAFRKNSCGPEVIVGFWRENQLIITQL